MKVGHHLAGYRKSDETRADCHEVHDELLEFAKGLARVRKNDPEAVFPYRLRPAAAVCRGQALPGSIQGAAIAISF